MAETVDQLIPNLPQISPANINEEDVNARYEGGTLKLEIAKISE
jgi:hypothetical protein